MRRISVAAVTVAGLFYSQTHPYEVSIVVETQVKEKRRELLTCLPVLWMIYLSVRSLFMKMNMCSPGMIYMVCYVWNIICLSEDVIFSAFPRFV